MAAMMNMTNLLNGKDSRWLQLEVCREYQRNKCSRPDTECKFAHPPANVEVQNGRVTACYDSIKGRCNREKPPCKYFHPPQHLKDQLLINGRNHLALKNAIMQQMGISPGQPVLPGQVPTVATNPYLAGMPTSTYSPYFPPGHLMPTLLGPADPSGVSQLGPVVQQAVVPQAQQKIPRSDRLETAPVSAAAAVAAAAAAAAATMGTLPPPPPPTAGAVNSTSLPISQNPLESGKKRAADNDMIQMMDMKTMGSFYYENFAFPGMVPYKRTAADKSGIPVYQPGATTYQQLMQLQQPFVPVSSSSTIPLNAPYVIYTDASGQLLDTLPVCQDFNRSMCTRPTCRFVHLMECDKVEVCDQRVAVCRDHAKGMCKRKQCKYYHIPIVLPPANVMAATAKLAE